MSTPLNSFTLEENSERAHLGWSGWMLLALGLGVLYAPTYWDAWNGIWQTEELGHGPIVAAVVVWLAWGARRTIADCVPAPSTILGWSLFLSGITFQVFGRVFNISSIEFLSQPLIFSGLILLIKGLRALRIVWFPIFYLVFMIPLPATTVDAITGPLKSWISLLVVELLYLLDYPITRSGVIIAVGHYQLLVADACSGLHSMFSLAALGALYMYIINRESRAHNIIMLISIAPIAFSANIVRVIILVLTTYHLGDEAAQGFLHGAAGMVLMGVALCLFFVLDFSIARALSRRLNNNSATPIISK